MLQSVNDPTEIAEVNWPSPEQSARALVTPKRGAEVADLVLPADGHRFAIDTARGPLAAYQAGAGPMVLLAHGFGGASSDFNAFVPALVARGFAIVALDFAGQGRSAGVTATIPDGAAALQALQASTGRFRGVIAHSLGCAITVESMADGLDVERVVFIAPPRRYGDYVEHIAQQHGWTEGYIAAVVTELLKLGVDTARLDVPNQVTGFTQPALILHSDNDRVLPLQFGEAVAQAWPGSIFMPQPGLGHRRILSDPSVIERAVGFIEQRP
jgi:pimeloyl-ACP methyl ester carboxylesterase